MTKFYCFLTGYDHSMVKDETPRSRRKVAMLGTAMLIPITVWAVSGFLMAYHVCGASFGASLFTAVFCSSVITFLERLILGAEQGRWTTAFRVILAFAVSIIGALAIDEIVFADDIALQLGKMKEQRVVEAKQHASMSFDDNYRLKEKTIALQQAAIRSREAEAEFIREMNGKGTGRIGFGTVAKQKQQNAAIAKSEQQKMQNQFDGLLVIKDSVLHEAAQQTVTGFSAGPLTKIKALAALVASDGTAMFVYIIFFLLMVMMEFSVVVFKSAMKKTNLERRMEMIEQIGEQRMSLLLSENSSLVSPSWQLPQAKAARESLGRSNVGLY